MVSNTVVEKVFATTSFDAILVIQSNRLVIQSDRLKPLADATPNAKFACIWEIESSYKYGFRTIFQRGLGLEAAGVKELMGYLGECLFMNDLCLLADSKFVLQRRCRG